ncbi:hypothetical protein [Frateuria sp. Soil773]|uniref:hypothetical protein n=1 Tax=Frateuria sp. Soil773 TaxID=1736407 RepID=UPI000ADFE821|nr:hypothetical protein [Frateuria sp. Soil773]
MNAQIALRHRPAAAWPPGRFFRGVSLAVLLAVLSAGLLRDSGRNAERATEPPLAQQLVHWQDAKHDWLMVVDPATRELVVYDATDGRPLERLGADDGLPDVQSIARQGSWLFVRGGRQPQMLWLKLPELRAVAVADR